MKKTTVRVVAILLIGIMLIGTIVMAIMGF